MWHRSYGEGEGEELKGRKKKGKKIKSVLRKRGPRVEKILRIDSGYVWLMIMFIYKHLILIIHQTVRSVKSYPIKVI